MKIQKLQPIEAYTDGSCKNNPGIGGWGWIAYTKYNRNIGPIFIYTNWGGRDLSTNQQMELHAMAEFLEFCPLGVNVSIFTDSTYVIGGIVGNTKELTNVFMKNNSKNQILTGWLNNWTKSNKILPLEKSYPGIEYWTKSDLKNDTEWYRIHQALLRHYNTGTSIKIGWVKGHSNVEGNDCADKLANKYYDTYHQK